MVSITYNGYNIPHNLGKFNYVENEKFLDVSIDFLLTAGSAGALETLADTAREKLTEINKDFKMSLGGSTEFDLSHTGSTGFNSRPTLSKVPDEFSTATSRHYRWECTIGLPFEQSGYDARREGSISIQYSTNRQRLVTFTVLYTATPALSAWGNYSAYAKLWAASILTGLGGNYEIVSEIPNYEHETKILTATLVYKEILAKQSEALMNDTSLVDMQCSYSLRVAQSYGKKLSTPSGQDAQPPVALTLFFSSAIDKEKVALETGIDVIYTFVIRPWLIKHAEDILSISSYPIAGVNNYIIQSEQKSYNIHAYNITGQMQILCPSGSNQITLYDEILTLNRHSGRMTEKLYNGKNHSRSMWNIGSTHELTRMITISRLNSAPPFPEPYNTDQFGVDGSGQWYLVNDSCAYTAEEVGKGTIEVGLVPAVIHTRKFVEQYIYIENLEEQASISE